MAKIRAPAFLYSDNNIDLWDRLQKECDKNEISIYKVNDLSDFFIKRKSLGLVILFIDKSTVNPSAEVMDFLNKCNEGWQSSIVVFLGDDKDEFAKKHFNVFMNSSIESIDDNFMQSVVRRMETEMVRLTSMCSQKVPASRIGRRLLEFGFSPKYLGSSYLVEVIEYTILNGGIVGNLQTTSYSYVAAKFFTTVMSIERNIRMAIEIAYKNKKEKFYGGKPSNKEFIAFIVNELKYGD